jgi:hypothetical protein
MQCTCSVVFGFLFSLHVNCLQVLAYCSKQIKDLHALEIYMLFHVELLHFFWRYYQYVVCCQIFVRTESSYSLYSLDCSFFTVTYSKLIGLYEAYSN